MSNSMKKSEYTRSHWWKLDCSHWAVYLHGMRSLKTANTHLLELWWRQTDDDANTNTVRSFGSAVLLCYTAMQWVRWLGGTTTTETIAGTRKRSTSPYSIHTLIDFNRRIHSIILTHIKNNQFLNWLLSCERTRARLVLFLLLLLLLFADIEHTRMLLMVFFRMPEKKTNTHTHTCGTESYGAQSDAHCAHSTNTPREWEVKREIKTQTYRHRYGIAPAFKRISD